MGTENPQELARLLLLVAGSLDAPGSTIVAGVLRRAARLVAQLPAPPGPDQCRGCGAPLEQPPTGRRRIWCSDRCRKRAGNGKVAA